MNRVILIDIIEVPPGRGQGREGSKCAMSGPGLQAVILCLGLFCLEVYGAADLALTSGHHSPLAVQERTLSYRLLVTNQGSEVALDVSLTHRLPEDSRLISASPSQGSCHGSAPIVCILGHLAPDARVVINFELIPDHTGNFIPSATVSSLTADVMADNDDLEIPVQVVALNASADLSVMLFAPDEVISGSRVSYSATVVNNGPIRAAAIRYRLQVDPLTLNSFLSADSTQGRCQTLLTTCIGASCQQAPTSPLVVECELGALPPGATARVIVTVEADLLPGGVLFAEAEVDSATTADPDRTNNTESERTRIDDRSRLSLSAGGEGCFLVATAQGSPLAGELDSLRRVRDRYLLTNAPGRALVRFYYAQSPAWAAYVSQHQWARLLARWVITWPLVLFSQYPWQGLLLVGGLVLTAMSLRRLKRYQSP